MIPVTVAQVSLSTMGFVVLLRSAADGRVLPIFIGAPEAQAIALFLDKVAVPRPLTHDLMKTVMDSLECRMKRAEILSPPVRFLSLDSAQRFPCSVSMAATKRAPRSPAISVGCRSVRVSMNVSIGALVA